MKKIHIVEGRSGSQTILDAELLLIIERLKAAFLTHLERKVKYIDDRDQVTALFGLVFKDGREMYFLIGNKIDWSQAEINWSTTKHWDCQFGIKAELVRDGQVFCEVYFDRVYNGENHDDIQSLKRIIDSANIPGLKFSLD
ncbi:hypothetical protein IKT64_02900 [Candidatus Saccharibacteria bacterium]|nr:hypothetical protein [Candidatus Saccharibacteria bacterium]